MIEIDLTGTTVLVTGASGGLGAAIAERFAGAGARVVLHYGRDEARAREVADRLAPAEVALAQADLTDEAAVEAMFADSAPYGPVDVLVNNAGVYPSAPLLELSGAAWAEVFRVNTEGTFSCLRAASAAMARRGHGAIVNIASLSALRPAAEQSHYNSSKAAVLALTRSAAVELAVHGIRVNAVSPGLIHREDLETSWPEGIASWQAHAPLGRLGDPADVANACVFLASPLASWITGHNLVVDGGISAAPAY